MEQELKNVSKIEEGKEAQTSSLYLKGAIESAKNGIEALYQDFKDKTEIFGQSLGSIFNEVEDKITALMKDKGFTRIDDGYLSACNTYEDSDHEEMTMLAFSPGVVVIMYFHGEPVQFEYGEDIIISLKSLRMVDLN